MFYYDAYESLYMPYTIAIDDCLHKILFSNFRSLAIEGDLKPYRGEGSPIETTDRKLGL